jgi:hypothetical protein
MHSRPGELGVLDASSTRRAYAGIQRDTLLLGLAGIVVDSVSVGDDGVRVIEVKGRSVREV